jgi:hypothetical protein
MNKEIRDMAEITGYAQLATRAADLADRCEAAGALVAAALLREVAQEVEEMIVRVAPPELPGWAIGRRAWTRRPSVIR